MAPATENAVQVLTESKLNYKVISFALDLTGKKLIDEICHITALEGDKALFDQYIMTYRDISRSSVRTHCIRIFTMLGKYRVLKDMTTMRSIHTKSEYSTLLDFLEWLTERKGNTEGVILAYHDNNGMDKVTPFLMEALERYHLTDEFFKVVKGFVNCCSVASNHPDIKGKSLALRSLARRLLGEGNKAEKTTNSETETSNGKDAEKTVDVKEEKETEIKAEKEKENIEKTSEAVKPKDEPKKGGEKDRRRRKAASREKSRLRDKEREQFNATQGSQYRAMTTYEVLHKISPPLTEPTIFEDELLKHLSTREEEMKTLEKQRELATKVRSLRPIFLGKIRTSPKDRSRAVLLRRYLIEAALDYNTLKQAYETGSTEAIMKIVEETSAKKKKQHLDELVELICQHFRMDPKKDINANELKAGDGDSGAGGDGGQTHGHGQVNPHDDDGSSTGSESGDESEAEFQEATGDN